MHYFTLCKILKFARVDNQQVLHYFPWQCSWYALSLYCSFGIKKCWNSYHICNSKIMKYSPTYCGAHLSCPCSCICCRDIDSIFVSPPLTNARKMNAQQPKTIWRKNQCREDQWATTKANLEKKNQTMM